MCSLFHMLLWKGEQNAQKQVGLTFYPVGTLFLHVELKSHEICEGNF